MAVETENFKGKHRNLKVSSERYLWKLSTIAVIRKVFFFMAQKRTMDKTLKRQKWTKLSFRKWLSSGNSLFTSFEWLPNCTKYTLSYNCLVKKKRSNDETENERYEAIESVSVIDGLITSRIVYENNTVND